MTDCDDDKEIRELPLLPSGADNTPDPDAAILVRRPTEKHELTDRQEVDVHTAITEGLASYLASLDGEIDGQSTRLQSVIANWPDRDDGQRPMPAAAVYSVEVAAYATDSGMAPGPPIAIGGNPQQRSQVITLTRSGVYQLGDLTVDVMCGDKVMRTGVRKMLEAGLWPVSWMAGFRLVLPRYHNAIATFVAVSAQQPDTGELALASMRPLSFRLRAHCQVYRVHRMPLSHVKATGTISGG